MQSETALPALVLASLYHHVGPEKAIRMHDLACDLRVSTRKLQMAVEKLRQDGYPVLSQIRPPYGYYWPASVNDGVAFQRQMENRAKADFAAVRAVNRGLRRVFGDDPQLEMELREA